MLLPKHTSSNQSHLQPALFPRPILKSHRDKLSDRDIKITRLVFFSHTQNKKKRNSRRGRKGIFFWVVNASVIHHSASRWLKSYRPAARLSSIWRDGVVQRDTKLRVMLHINTFSIRERAFPGQPRYTEQKGGRTRWRGRAE